MIKKEKTISSGALLLLAGGIIGAVAALLYAPQSGQRTRRSLNKYAKKVRMRTKDATEDLKDNINNMVETIGDKTDILVERGKEVAGGARKDLIRLIEEGASKLEKFRTKLSGM